MGFSGLIAGGVNDALGEIQAEQLKALALKIEEELKREQMQLQRDQLASLDADRQAGNALQARTIDLNELKRRDDNNARGLDLMNQDRQRMDVDDAVASLPPHLKPISGLFKAGAMGKLSPEDLQSPEEREAAREREIQERIRVANATRPPQRPERVRPEWVRQPDGSVVDLNGVAPSGSKPYDAVAERSSKPVNDTEAQDTAQEAGRLAKALLEHKGLKGTFGVLDQYLPTVRQDTSDAETLLNSLTGLLTMENMGKMKGVLSDTDMKILRQASTTLSQGMSESAARAELQRIVDVMGRIGSGAAPVAGESLGDVAFRFNPATGKLEPVRKGQ